jgi:anthranilate 1,2-dioxygenase small subunit
VRTMQDGEMVMFSAGRYLDEIVIEGDNALLQKRIVITDSWRYDTLVAIPL